MAEHDKQSKRRVIFTSGFLAFALLWTLSCLTFLPTVSADGHNDHHSSAPLDPKQQAKILADKQESEMNHHIAGFLVVLAGIFIWMQPRLEVRWPWVKYAWPACFLIAGLFVLAWSDTELWPWGPKSWLTQLRTDREVLQHKTFAILLLGLGFIDWRRAQGKLKAAWSGWAFPVVAIVGSIILIFHEHAGGTVGEHHTETMALIQSEHTSYMVCGLGIGISKGLGQLKSSAGRFFDGLWPLLMVVVGAMLMFYRE